MEIAFLFGAGVSIPSGMDNTEDLTEKILVGENVVRLTSRYFPEENPTKFNWDSRNEYINRIKKLSHILYNNLGSHYSFIGRPINYEDYYYMVDSMHTDEDMEFENPIVTYFSEYLFRVHCSLFEPIETHLAPLRLIDLMSEAKNYIKDLVAFYLDKKPEDLNQFKLLSDLNEDKSYSKVYIFTINHDTLVEQYLSKNEIKYSDGFEEKGENVKVWNSNSYNEKINLFKLHGSINWAHYNSSNDPYKRKVCVYSVPPRNADVSHPIIIVGSFNKLSEYSRGINFDLQNLYAQNLNKCNRLVISGYSFCDQGINSRIINWLYGSRDREIIVIHKNQEELFRNSRPAIRNVQDTDLSAETNLFKIIPKWFQETSWQEIKGLIN